MVFFDNIDLKFEYETEGYQLGSVRYLPDFWFPQIRLWAEAKPTTLKPEEQTKANLLAVRSGFDVLLLVGPPECRLYPGATMDAGEVTHAFYSLDIHFHRKQFKQGRLWSESESGDWLDDDSFTERYKRAMGEALSYDFREAA
jgi:hypothetical protein